MSARRRCTECRKTFDPAITARDTQRVCGAACRASRDRRLARARRRRELDDYRADERERQCTRRERREADGCHAPPSAPKCAELPREVVEIVDRLVRVSRATLLRQIRGFFQRGVAPGVAKAGAMSRATLAAGQAENALDPTKTLAAHHA
jgi:hypothetical protein